MEATATRQLIEVRLGTSLESFVAPLRAEGKGWRPIARALTAATGVPVTHETLRTWLPEPLSLSA